MTTRSSAIIPICIIAWLTASCATSHQSMKMEQVEQIPFHYVNQTFIAIPVTVNDTITRDFILDTGIGLNLISKSICEKVACSIFGKHVGKRMSGQEITIPLSSVDSLALSELKAINAPVGVFDIDQMMPGSNIAGFLSLGFFRNRAFTVDYKHQVITIETENSLSKIRSLGTRVPVKLDKQGEALGAFLPLLLPSGQQVSVEVDTGSQELILDEKFMAPLGISPSAPTTKRRKGKDETGHFYLRYFTKITGSVHLAQDASFNADSPEVMFQKIIYDGLVGHHFLRQFVVTYDLAASEMIFRKPKVDE